jgi:hypothetical protein
MIIMNDQVIASLFVFFMWMDGYCWTWEVTWHDPKRDVVTVGKQTHDLTVTASDSKTTQSGGDNRKKFQLGAALQVPQNFSFAPL